MILTFLLRWEETNINIQELYIGPISKSYNLLVSSYGRKVGGRVTIYCHFQSNLLQVRTLLTVGTGTSHCIKSVRIWSYSIFPYFDENNSEYRLFTQFYSLHRHERRIVDNKN